jgi:FkbM family methyltransferase
MRLSNVLPRLLLKMRLQSCFHFETRISVNRKTVRIPIAGKLGYHHLDSHEPWMLEALAGLLKLRSGTFLDVGVNIGQTLVKVKSLDPARPYIGVEPNPVCVYYLEMLIRANDFQSCHVIPAALSTGHAILELQIYSDSLTDASASIVDGFRENRISTRPALACAYSDIEQALKPEPLGIVKIDVEGAEWEVIQSLDGVLASARPFVLMEILPVHSAGNESRFVRQKAIETRFRQLRYGLYRICPDEAGNLKGIKRVPDIGVHGDISMCDYIAVPDEAQAGLGSTIRIL